MKLYLIRHAQSVNNALYIAGRYATERSPDPEITEIGHKQSALLGQLLANPQAEPRQNPFDPKRTNNFGITHLYCSLMTRSILTAEYISNSCNLPLQAHVDIFEKGGIFELQDDGARRGLPAPKRDYFEQRFPKLELPTEFNEDGWYNRPAESTETFNMRVTDALADIRSVHEHTDDVVAMVVHGDFIDQAINEIMGVARGSDNYSGIWHGNWATNNTSISRFDFEDGAHKVIYLNRVDHLPAELITV